MKTLLILRAVPDTGKTLFANTMVGKEYTVSADDYFEELAQAQGKTYSDVFNFAALGHAHRQCKERCEALMTQSCEKIAVANTNVEAKHMKDYEALAEKYGYTVFHVVLEKRHNGNSNGHSVPQEVKDSMEVKLRNSLKLQ